MRPSSAETSEPAWTKRKMLSMKRRTSWPCSRKYSAIVRPDSATRMRAPGGSFIWPKTSIVLSMTPDSFISSQRSLPSRERSPTPQNADRPPCSWARLWISSWMITVLPTPAPPNRPTLPPLAYGASRSTTLMPVSNISVVGVRFSTDGAERWIGQRCLTSISPPSSIGSPSRLKMRPSVTSPTGTVIGPPVSSTSIPRARPSVVSMATARTRSSPRCCCTSHTSTPASPPPARSGSSSPVGSWRTMIAELISGSLSGNTASMTTPWISSIRPTFFWPSRCPSGFCCSVVSSVLASTAFLSDQGFRPGNDFHDLLGDLGLALAVHLQRQVLDQLAGVLGRVAHRGYARAVLGGGGLEQRAVNRDLDVRRHEPLEDLLGVGLVLDERARPGALVALLVVAAVGT